MKTHKCPNTGKNANRRRHGRDYLRQHAKELQVDDLLEKALSEAAEKLIRNFHFPIIFFRMG